MTSNKVLQKNKSSRYVFSYVLFILIFDYTNLQRLRYASRFRNVSISSETGSAYLVNMSLFIHKMDHRVACDFNITKNIYSKNIHVVIHRCIYERFTCEYFQTWKFRENFNAIVYMRNQIWTPIFDYLAPKLDFPLIKKSVYRASNASIDAEKLMIFYNDANKFYWKADIEIYDNDGKKAMIVHYELNVFEYVERIRNKTRKKGY